MRREFENIRTKGKLVMFSHCPELSGEGMLTAMAVHFNTIVVNKSPQEQKVIIDGVDYTMGGATLLPLVGSQHVEFTDPAHLVAWRFNREFYCIVDHDEEVSCVGFLFFGIHHPMFIRLCEQDLADISTIEALFEQDLGLVDRMQEEMLRTLLKRLIIKATRLARVQSGTVSPLPDTRFDTIRRFSLLVELHFRSRHDVGFYADLLHKSPKTLSNLFRLCGYPSPLSVIHSRIILEANRYLHYTTRSAKETADALGFESLAHFSRFYTTKTGINFSRVRP